jgi:DNA-binding NarL/FixJ family response regulator
MNRPPEEDDSRRLRVLIAHHHPATRAGVHESLESAEFLILGEAADAAGAVELALRERPDVCLLDPELPGNGIKAAEKITSTMPGVSVVMLSRCDRTGGLLDALRAGAVGYLLLETDPERLPHALRGVISGEAAIPRRLVARLIEEFRARESRRVISTAEGPAAALTSREWEVVEMLRDGLSSAQMADRLLLSPVTVRRHISRVAQKLGADDRRSLLNVIAASQPAAA